MDDLTKKVLNEIPEPATEEVESPTTETNDTEVQQEETQASESESEETVEQPTKEESEASEPPKKKGAESRIRELNAKAKQAEADAQKERAEKESLALKIQELTDSVESQGQPQLSGYDPNKPLIAPGEEVTQEELQRRVAERDKWLLQQANNMTRFEIAKKETLDRVNRESNEAIKAYPQLDPDSDSFDDELSESVSQATLSFVRTNPTGSVKKFVDGLMKPYMRSLDKSVASQQGEIVKQASQTAMRPNNIPSTEKKPEDMDIKELEKKLGIVY